MNIVNKTNVPEKKVGDGLNASEVNAINSTLNQEVEVGNSFLKSFCNLNQECGDFSKTFSLGTAINSVPEARRSSGMTISFLGSNKKYNQYIFSGSDIKDWKTQSLWSPVVSVIDGGEW